MKKGIIKYYIISWLLVLALFNIVAFVPIELAGPKKYSDAFWIGYTLISTSFAIQLVVSVMVFSTKSSKETFYNIPALRKSISTLVVALIFGGTFMIVPSIAGWIVLILYAAILILNTLKLFKTLAAADLISSVDDKVQSQTLFIKSLTVDANTLLASAKSASAKAECQKVYEAIRYSDPMSNDFLADVEEQITVKFSELSEAVKADDADKITALASEVIVLVGDRNKKCKLLK